MQMTLQRLGYGSRAEHKRPRVMLANGIHSVRALRLGILRISHTTAPLVVPGAPCGPDHLWSLKIPLTHALCSSIGAKRAKAKLLSYFLAALYLR